MNQREYAPVIARRDGDGQDVAALVSDINRFGRQMQSRQALLSNPHVKSALTQLDRQLAGALGQSHGRHRVLTNNARTSEVVSDTWGYNLKPNPLQASTATELISALRRYRKWAGNTPFRKMAAKARFEVAHSTMCVALNGTELPPLKVVIAIVVGCGGSSDDQERFATAWRRIDSGRSD